MAWREREREQEVTSSIWRTEGRTELCVGLCVYRQVVAAVAADQRRLVVAIGLVSFSLQTGDTQQLKPLQQTALLLI